MTITSRTPEGFPSRCPLCDAATNLEFSEPAGDAPCPNCGHLLWKSAQLLGEMQHVLSEGLGVPQHEVVANTSLSDIGADSLEIVELIMEFEDEFGVVVPDDEYDRIRTIGDAVRYILQRQRAGDSVAHRGL